MIAKKRPLLIIGKRTVILKSLCTISGLCKSMRLRWCILVISGKHNMLGVKQNQLHFVFLKCYVSSIQIPRLATFVANLLCTFIVQGFKFAHFILCTRNPIAFHVLFQNSPTQFWICSKVTTYPDAHCHTYILQLEKENRLISRLLACIRNQWVLQKQYFPPTIHELDVPLKI